MLGRKFFYKFPEHSRNCAWIVLVFFMGIQLMSCRQSPTAEFREGEKLLDAGKYEDAAGKLESAAKSLENNVNAWNKLGLAFQYQNKLLEAEEAYNKAINVDPSFPDVHFNLGQLYLDTKQYPKAIENLRKYCFIVSDSVSGNVALSIAQRKSGNFAEALVSLETARSIKSDDPSILHEMALTYYEDGKSTGDNDKKAQAQTYLEDLIQQSPEFTPAYLTRAIIYHETHSDDPAQVINFYQDYLTRNPPTNKAVTVTNIIQNLQDALKKQQEVALPEINIPVLTNVVSKIPSDNNEVVINAENENNTNDSNDTSTNKVDLTNINWQTDTNSTEVTPDTPTHFDLTSLEKPNLEVAPGGSFDKPEIPRVFGYNKNIDGYQLVIVPVTPEPIRPELEEPVDESLVYPFEEIENLLSANKQILAAYGLSMPTDLPDDYFRNSPVPEGVTPLEPLPSPNTEFLETLNGSTPNTSTNNLALPPREYVLTTNRVESPIGVNTTNVVDNSTPNVNLTNDVVEISDPILPRNLSSFPRYEFGKIEIPLDGDRLKARPFFLDGVQAYKAKQSQLAIDFFEQAVEKDPGYFEAQFNLGILYLQTSQNLKAVTAFEKSTFIRPKDMNVTYNLGRSLGQMDFVADAIELLDQVIQTNPEHLGAHFTRAKLYQEKVKDIPQAVKDYQRVLEIKPDHPQSTNIRYWLRENQ